MGHKSRGQRIVELTSDAVVVSKTLAELRKGKDGKNLTLLIGAVSREYGEIAHDIEAAQASRRAERERKRDSKGRYVEATGRPRNKPASRERK